MLYRDINLLTKFTNINKKKCHITNNYVSHIVYIFHFIYSKYYYLFSAIKNLGEKAEGILEEQKKKVEELAIEKKNAAAAMLEQQV